MRRHIGYIGCVLCIAMLGANVAMAGDKGKNADGEKKARSSDSEETNKSGGQERAISGMSIIGTDETPKSLVIVPWKSSEIGRETKLKSDLLNDGLDPVDHEVFTRELNFYKLANPK